MLQERFTQGMSCKEFLNTDTPQVKEKALKRWETIKFSSQDIEDIKNSNEGNILAYMRLSCPDCMLVLPLLEKINAINPEIKYSILPIEGREEELKEIANLEEAKVPTFIFFKNDEIKGLFLERPENFQKRLRGLDEEDTEELITRYRRGSYNHYIVAELLELLGK